jgi:hypothetical protein
MATAKPSEAAYGDAARVFAGKVTNKSGKLKIWIHFITLHLRSGLISLDSTDPSKIFYRLSCLSCLFLISFSHHFHTGFTPYAGEGFALLLPAKWNPSKEKDFSGVVLRYEDNFDAVNNLFVIQQKVGKDSIDGLGSPDKFLQDNAYLFGDQAAFNQSNSRSEGGFAPGKIAAASVLDVQEATDKNGKKYYKYEVVTRTSDGNEGGRHHLVAATVSKGDLYVLKVQVGDKRWFKGASIEALGAWNSFTVA